MKKKSKKGYKLSDETLEKLKVQKELKEKEEEEAKSKLSKKELRKLEKKNVVKDERKSIPKTIETLFSIVYLGFLVICIWKFFSLSKSNKTFLLFGCLTVILAFGDAFHLIPRILDNLKRKRN